jgi:hypothetical protein
VKEVPRQQPALPLQPVIYVPLPAGAAAAICAAGLFHLKTASPKATPVIMLEAQPHEGW